jgi:hypothetical protein
MGQSRLDADDADFGAPVGSCRLDAANMPIATTRAVVIVTNVFASPRSAKRSMLVA